MKKYNIFVYGETLSEILVSCQQHALKMGYTERESALHLGFHTIKIEQEWNYDCESVVAVFTLPTSDLEFQIAQQKYERKLREYNEWCAENEAEIRVELEHRKQQKLDEDAAIIQRKVNKLSAELAKNQEKLKKLGLD